MPTAPLFPLTLGLDIPSVREGTEEVIVRVTSSRTTSCCHVVLHTLQLFIVITAGSHVICPVPDARSGRSSPCENSFARTLAVLKTCLTPRFPDFIAVFSRLTLRLRNAVQEIGYATCGKGGERLSVKLGAFPER